MERDGSAQHDPRYDAFVVRLWRNAATGQITRAEVEHIRTGARARAANVPTAWVLGQITAHLSDGVAAHGAAIDVDPSTPCRSPPVVQKRGGQYGATKHEGGFA